MYGAILGDIIGSPYEFDMGDKTKDFPLFSEDSYFTDDTAMTIAVSEAFMDTPDNEDAIRQRLNQAMRKWGHRYPGAGYGVRFSGWLDSKNPQPYNSWGNGSAMRPGCITIWTLFGECPAFRRSHPQPPRRHQGCRSNCHRHIPSQNRKQQSRDQGLHRK